MGKIKSIFSRIVDFGKFIKISLTKHNKYNVIKAVIDSGPWDYSYLWEIERAKLIEMRDYFATSNITYDDEKNSREINLAIKMLDIITERVDLFHFEDPYPDEEKEKIWEKDNNGTISTFNGDYWHRHHQYVCDVNVNTKNINRFVKEDVIPYYMKMPHELYLEKARHLYHMIRERLEQNWSN